MNAQEARNITISNKKSFISILETIETMAKAGHDYATISTKDIQDPEGYAEKLIEMGYEVKVDDYFSIKW